MAISLSFVENNIRPNYWISRRNGDGDFVNDYIDNLKEGDNVMFNQDATETEYMTALNLAKSKGLRFVAPRECNNGVIQVWTVLM